MKQDIIIQYDTAKLKEQHDIICASRMKAFQKVIGDAYVRTLVLKQDDPPELWRFAFGKCGSLTPLTHKEKQMAKGISARLRQLDPQATGTPETYEQFKAARGTPTFRETVQSLTHNASGGDELAKRLSKLIGLHNLPPMTREEYDQARQDSDLTTRLLIQNWIQDPPGKNWPYDSFCYFSDRALAKVLYYISRKEITDAVQAAFSTAWQPNGNAATVKAAAKWPGVKAYRCVGDNNEVRGFQVFSPAVLCGIGALPGTLHDRSIVICLERAKPGELRERFDSRRVECETELCRKLARWCVDNASRLESSDPALPPSAFNRLADNWRPLFAVAEIAGGDWPQRAADAFTKLTGKEDSDAQGIGTVLLADIRQVFAETRAARIFSKTLVETLCAMTDRPWPEAHRGKPITENWLARRLHGFEVNSRTLRIGDDRAKGYEAADFKEAFERYLPSGAIET